MRTLLLVPVLLLFAAPAAAQIQRAAPAFELSLGPWIGVTSFGTRQTGLGRDASYRGSFTAGVRGELPLTQRVGLLGNVSLSPFAKQRTETEFSTELHEQVTVFRADAALGFRFIPRAPVFFFAGGGVLAASKPAFPDFDESVIEPRGLFGLGYDRTTSGSWNFRVAATGFITKPAEPDATSWSGSNQAPALSIKSTTFDWVLEFGARYRFRRGS
jgi:hypothetical protein